jgi:hypothetical protein
MKNIGILVNQPLKVYLTGGASAVLLGFRNTTIDVDVKFIPDTDEVLKLIPSLKEKLKMNIELASPSDFIPELPGWNERSRFIEQQGNVHFFHYDFYSQVLAKIERGHAQDMEDIKNFIGKKYVDAEQLLNFFYMIKDKLYRYPAIDPESFERDVKNIVKKFKKVI